MEPITGRTHQLRVHSAASGWPIVGDNIYGNGPRFGELSLHLHERLKACGWNGEETAVPELVNSGE
jgi:tRNA pseudouridine32 synthase/23S rRNA pseudouridine746 synthase